MLGFIIAMCMLLFFGKLLLFGIKAAWGISKFIFTIVLLPILLIVLFIAGLVYIAIPLLIIVGIVSFVISKA